jgi:hypothetical protein
LVFKAERPKQAQAQSNNTHTQEAHKVTANNIKDTYQLAILRVSSIKAIELVLFFLGSWLVITVEVFIFLDTASVEILMVVVDEPFMMIWKVQILKVFLLTSHSCEVFGKVGEVLHMRQCLMPGLNISSQATESLILDDCKSASPRRNKVSSSAEPFDVNQSKIFVNVLLPLQLEKFEDILLKFAPSCAAKLHAFLGTSSNR